MSNTTEETLPSYGLAGTAVRVDNTVRRVRSDWSPTIARLITHVRAKGVSWIPAFHGFDEKDREILDYIDGDSGVSDDIQWDEDVLADIAHRLREWHDATVDFEVTPDDVWFDPGRLPREVIGHNTFASRSHIFRNDTFVGAIHFDHCYPTSRLWDLAYTAYFYVPLAPPAEAGIVSDAPPSPFDVPKMGTRLEAFLNAYGAVVGLDGETRTYEPRELLAILGARLHDMADRADLHADPNLRAQGSVYRAHANWVESGALDG